MEWPKSVKFFSRSELLKIHPSSRKLANLLKRSVPNQYNTNTGKTLEDISKHCQSCQRMAFKPFIFQVSIPDDVQFNHEVNLDLTWLEARPYKPALRIVDRGNYFSAAEFLQGENAEDI